MITIHYSPLTTHRTFTLSVFGLAATLACATAEDWPQWGGNDPGRNMYSPARNLPILFNPGKLKPGTEDIDLQATKNVKWVNKLGSQSYGNPVVAGGKVYVRSEERRVGNEGR